MRIRWSFGIWVSIILVVAIVWFIIGFEIGATHTTTETTTETTTCVLQMANGTLKFGCLP